MSQNGLPAEQDHRIQVPYRGVVCLFDGSPVAGLEHPGVIYQALLGGRFYEHAFLDHIRRLGIRGAYVDVGACIGTHALFFALMCPSTRVYAFEPRDHLFECLTTNIALNDQVGKVTAYPYALSDRDEVVTANLDGTDWPLACRRLDALISSRVDVIKIDVEGMEPKVIDGAAAILAKWRPRVFAEAGQPAQYERLVEAMARHAYRPTGRVFNATPTYEFVPISDLWIRRLEANAGTVASRARRAMRRLTRRR